MSIQASVDIGTNSVLLLVARLENGELTVLEERQSIPRLGRGVDEQRNLSEESMQRVLNVLTGYRQFLKENYPVCADEVVITATSAVRDSGNRDLFIQRIQNVTGWTVRLLSGQEEAETTYSGALSVLNIPETANKRYVIIDIGGGSTEIAMGSSRSLKSGRSYDMGSVRFSERFLKESPPGKKQIEKLKKEVRTLLDPDAGFGTDDAELIGVAGTVTSIAAIELNLELYQSGRLNGVSLSLETISQYVNTFSEMLPEEIEKKYPLFLKGRGDVILGGLLILQQFMECCAFSELTVSTGGIRHGILLQ
jgi:exopolyphosphatase / guanosine-5'-triphosphate,3'-diphosphate pyrophosphatase